MNIVILGLSITSSWGNGHATTYRSLVRGLASRGHTVLFLERNMPWYQDNRDLPRPPYGRTALYDSREELERNFGNAVASADLVIVGSFVPEGVAVIEWVLAVARGTTAFYDIDTPVTLERLRDGTCDYVSCEQVPRFDLYLSFTGGPVLDTLEREFSARCARPLYCGVDPDKYSPVREPERWHLGYLGTYSADRQPALELRLIEPARRWPDGRFIVAGAQFPDDLEWPGNVERVDHLPPGAHRAFYCAQRFTLNVTRAAMVKAGYSPSVRLFEAAACATPIISDWWDGLDTFFTPGEEIFVTGSAEETLSLLRGVSERERQRVSDRARARVLAAHTASHRAQELEQYAAAAARNTAGSFVARASDSGRS